MYAAPDTAHYQHGEGNEGSGSFAGLQTLSTASSVFTMYPQCTAKPGALFHILTTSSHGADADAQENNVLSPERCYEESADDNERHEWWQATN